MCEHCIVRGKKAWEELALPADTKKIIEQAIRANENAEEHERGVREGEDSQRADDEHEYKRKIMPLRDALLDAADEAARRTDLDARFTLDNLVAAVRRHASAIPTRLP